MLLLLLLFLLLLLLGINSCGAVLGFGKVGGVDEDGCG